MRVLYVTKRFTPHDRRFLRAIRAQGHQPWYCGLEDTTRPEESAPSWPRSSIEDWPALLDKHSIDVVHAGPIPTVAARVAAHVQTPLVAMSWGSDILVDAVRDPALRSRAVAAIRRADALIGDCKAIWDQIRSWVPDCATPYVQFPWGVDLTRFAEPSRSAASSVRQRLGWSDLTVLISTRSWEPLYGIDRLLESFALCAAKHPDLRLILASGGSLDENVRKQMRLLGLSSKVHCPGVLGEEELPAWYGAADLYVSSASSDGSSISLLEAMAAGLPVLVNEGHGNLEWVEPKINGWLVDCGSAAEIARGIEKALEDRRRWRDMGQDNRLVAAQRADWNRNSMRISEAYELAQRRRAFA